MAENKQTTHQLKPMCMPSDVRTGGRSVEGVVNFINGFDKTRIQNASIAYSDAQEVVNTAKTELETQARELAKHWEGSASVEAQQALGVLFVTLGELAEKLGAMSAPLTSLATVVDKHQSFITDTWKGVMPTWANQSLGTWNDSITDYYSTYTGVYGGDNATGKWGSQDELAGHHLQVFSNDLAYVHTEMPNTLDTVLRTISLPGQDEGDLDPIDYSQFGGTDNGGLGNGGYDPDMTGMPNGGVDPYRPSLGAYDPSNGSGLPGSGTNPGDYPGGGDSGGRNPGGQDLNGTGANGNGANGNGTGANGNGTGPNTSLQDYNPSLANTGTNPTTSGYGTTPAYNSGSTSTGGGGVYGGGGGMVPTTGGLNGRTSSVGRNGMPFMPMGGMGGGGAGQESSDRESTTWLHEDDDVWGGDSNSAVNDRIG